MQFLYWMTEVKEDENDDDENTDDVEKFNSNTESGKILIEVSQNQDKIKTLMNQKRWKKLGFQEKIFVLKKINDDFNPENFDDMLTNFARNMKSG